MHLFKYSVKIEIAYPRSEKTDKLVSKSVKGQVKCEVEEHGGSSFE